MLIGSQACLKNDVCMHRAASLALSQIGLGVSHRPFGDIMGLVAVV